MTSPTEALHTLLGAHKLTGPNFLDWLVNLRIVLRSEKIEYVLDSHTPPVPAFGASCNEWAAYRKHHEDAGRAQCIMLASMSAKLQKQHEHMDAHLILFHLNELFGEVARTERYEISKALFRARMEKGSSPQLHVLKMNGYIERLTSLGLVIDNRLCIDLILHSMPGSYGQMVHNYTMNGKDLTIPELVKLLKAAEPSVKDVNESVTLVDSSQPGSSKKGSKKKKEKEEKRAVASIEGGVAEKE